MIREPVVNGRFYPASSRDLSATIEECEQHELGAEGKSISANGVLRALIQPHAGYVFSGPVATWGIKRLSTVRPLPGRILMLGPKHTPYGANASASAADGWKTPLGVVSIDPKLRDAILKTGAFQTDDEAHAQEHSLEVQLPFLQRLYGNERLGILPIALHYSSFKDCETWGEAIKKVLDDPALSDTVVLVSSDFSHDTPRNDAYRLDGEALNLIEKMDAKGFYDLVVSEDRSICGFIPITVAMLGLRGRSIKARRLTYATSMDVMPHPRGVGYASVVFEEESRPV